MLQYQRSDDATRVPTAHLVTCIKRLIKEGFGAVLSPVKTTSAPRTTKRVVSGVSAGAGQFSSKET